MQILIGVLSLLYRDTAPLQRRSGSELAVAAKPNASSGATQRENSDDRFRYAVRAFAQLAAELFHPRSRAMSAKYEVNSSRGVHPV